MMWKKIENLENFSISENGLLRNDTTGRILKSSRHPNGYMLVTNKPDGRNGKSKSLRLHRVVAKAFVSNPENKSEVNHKDCDKENNHYSNLEWVTSKENMSHAVENDLLVIHRGEDNILHKITDLQVVFIRENYSKYGPRKLGRMLDISHVHVININKGKHRNVAHVGNE